jgi:hypothetical protein
MADTLRDSIAIGKIVRSESHVRYTCQVYGPGEIADPPEPADFAFGSFVRTPLRVTPARAGLALLDALALPPADGEDPLPQGSLSPQGHMTPGSLLAVTGSRRLQPVSHASCYAVGLIYDTILLNPAFGTLGPRLSNDEQVALFSPDYLAERAVLVSILLLGTLTARRGGGVHVSHGIPPIAPDLSAEVSALPDDDLRVFHFFADHAAPGGARPYLHMGYLPHAIAQDNPLLPMAMLRTIDRLERLFPENAALLSIVKRNFAWRLKVQTAG